jgi:two-component system, chemotaxis family, CheB/CheR fusion protein
MHIEPNAIYVSPINVELIVSNGTFRLQALTDQKAPRHSIDVFFRSLSAQRGAAAVGVILSGSGTDGTLGLKAIKEEGGITFVQEPSSASQPSMPQSAIDAGCADFVLSAAEIGDELMRISRHPYTMVLRTARVFDEEPRSKLFVLLRNAFGVDFSAYKQTTIERRIQRRMVLHKVERLDDYLRFKDVVRRCCACARAPHRGTRARARDDQRVSPDDDRRARKRERRASSVERRTSKFERRIAEHQ